MHLLHFVNTLTIFFFISTDGTLHNLNEYMEMSSVDVVKTVGNDTVDAVISQKFGVLLSENQLEDFFSKIF